MAKGGTGVAGDNGDKLHLVAGAREMSWEQAGF